MIKSKYKWQERAVSERIDDAVAKRFKLNPITRQVLESKGYTTASDIEKIIEQPTISHDVSQLSDIERTVSRIQRAIDNGERILVYGDYDADGVTSTTILVQTLQTIGAEVGWYIPNRFTEGYGPNEMAFRNALDEGVSLIITVDNGIQGHHEIQVIQDLGVDVIVTDHHEIGASLPPAYAVVHPMHPDYTYPFKYLCGAGVAYKLAQALLDDVPKSFLALATIGTIADLVSLTDENRSIVQQGLTILNDDCPIAIQALLNEAGHKDVVTEETIGFIIGPRLNAVGRLDDASLAAELLMTDDMEEAVFLAEQVCQFNQERKDIVAEITEEALVMADEKTAEGSKFLVLAKEGWHEGVLGIVASRIVETTGLPTLMLNIDHDNDYAKGSARSIEQVSMFDMLSKASDKITKFGGHHMAAGMTMPIDQIDALQAALDAEMQILAETVSLQPVKHVDVRLNMNDITVAHIRSLDRLRPFGTDFTAPTFMLEDVSVQSVKAIGKEKNHLKLALGEQQLQALFWQNGHLQTQLEPNEPLNILGSLQINVWNGNASPQMILTDIKSEGLQILDYRSKDKMRQLASQMSTGATLVQKREASDDAHVFEYGETIPESYETIFLKDLPRHLEHLKTSLMNIQPSTIYVMLNHTHSIYLEGVPKPAHFKQCYKALLQKQETDIAREGMQLSQFLNVKPELVKFMLKVFLELGFIKQENGIITISHDTEKQAIETSALYQARTARMEVETLLLYSNFEEIKSWIRACMIQQD